MALLEKIQQREASLATAHQAYDTCLKTLENAQEQQKKQMQELSSMISNLTNTLNFPSLEDITRVVMSSLSLAMNKVYERRHMDGEAGLKAAMIQPQPLITVMVVSPLRPPIPTTTASSLRVSSLLATYRPC